MRTRSSCTWVKSFKVSQDRNFATKMENVGPIDWCIPTFGEIADQVWESRSTVFRNEKHKAQWKSTLETYAAPLRSKPADIITTDDVLAVLKPIWSAKPETASRVRGRIEKVLDAAASTAPAGSTLTCRPPRYSPRAAPEAFPPATKNPLFPNHVTQVTPSPRGRAIFVEFVEEIRRIGASAHRRIGASAHRRIGASAHRRIGASAHRRIGF